MYTVIYHYNSMIIICRYSTTQYSPLPAMCNIHTIAWLLAMQNTHYHIFAGIAGMAEDYLFAHPSSLWPPNPTSNKIT